MAEFVKLVEQSESELIVEACLELGLDLREADEVLATHRRSPFLLDLVHAHGGSAKTFVRARIEIRRTLRALG